MGMTGGKSKAQGRSKGSLIEDIISEEFCTLSWSVNYGTK